MSWRSRTSAHQFSRISHGVKGIDRPPRQTCHTGSCVTRPPSCLEYIEVSMRYLTKVTKNCTLLIVITTLGACASNAPVKQIISVGKYGEPLDSETNHKISDDEFHQHNGNVLNIEKHTGVYPSETKAIKAGYASASKLTS